MATARVEKKIIVTMNPDELRALADKMERDFPKKLTGDSTFIDCIVYSLGGVRVDLHADQEWFNKAAKLDRDRALRQLTRST